MRPWLVRLLLLLACAGLGLVVGLFAPLSCMQALGIRGRELVQGPPILLWISLGAWTFIGLLLVIFLRCGRDLAAEKPPRSWLDWVAWGLAAGLFALGVSLPSLLGEHLGEAGSLIWLPAIASLWLWGARRRLAPVLWAGMIASAALALAAAFFLRTCLNLGCFESDAFSWQALAKADRGLWILVLLASGWLVLPGLSGLVAGMTQVSYNPLRGLLAGALASSLAPLVLGALPGIETARSSLLLAASLPLSALAGGLLCLPGAFLGRGLRGIAALISARLDLDAAFFARPRLLAGCALGLALLAWAASLWSERAHMTRVERSIFDPTFEDRITYDVDLRSPTWSADGDRILFEAQPHYSMKASFEVDADGSDLARIATRRLEDVLSAEEHCPRPEGLDKRSKVILAPPDCAWQLVARATKAELVVFRAGRKEPERVTLELGDKPYWWAEVRSFSWDEQGERCRFLYRGKVWEMGADLQAASEVFSVGAKTGWSAEGTYVWQADRNREGLLIREKDLYSWIWLDSRTHEIQSETKPISLGGKLIASPVGRDVIQTSGAYDAPAFAIVDLESGQRAQVLAMDAVFGTRCAGWTLAVLLVWLGAVFSGSFKGLAAWLRRRNTA
ncbi:MAG: hypothetical protein JXR96_18690 [Deltaproteobacteria bacterium]|nr:hypothetical protein [Deltaproteobacteria bacterium]